MATLSATTSQRDFSAGEVDSEVKRDDTNPLMKAGARQMRNWRIMKTKGLTNRPGRRALFLETGRVELVTMAPGFTFFLAFGVNTLKVYDADGTLVFSQGVLFWDLPTVRFIRWVAIENSIYIACLGVQPQVLTWDGISTWTLTGYSETVTPGNQKRTFFYRISPLGVTMQPSTRTPGAGATLTFSAGMNLTVGHIGTRMRYIGRQILITAVASATSATATIEETLPASQILGFSVDPITTFSIGDKVQGLTTNSIAIITQINSGAKQITVQLLGVNTTVSVTTTASPGRAAAAGQFVYAFQASEILAGPGGSLPILGVTSVGNPEPVTIWDDEVMNGLRGWPTSVFADQNRLGFCNFPSVPRGIGWSAIGLPYDLYPDAQPDNAIFELAPQKCQVFDVVPGPESSEFVFTDKGIWYIAISATNPLKPGSVGFQRVSGDVCANVQPCIAQELVVYLTASLDQVMAIFPIGATNRPFTTRELTDQRQHLFNNPYAITATSDGRGEIYVLNGDGTVILGRLAVVEGQINIQGIVGWMPWDGGSSASILWVDTFGFDVLFTTQYTFNSVTYGPVVELLDKALYLDAALLVNSVPAAMTPPPGKGPLWWLRGAAVDLMDQITRMMGTYQVDADGFIVPQGAGGEDLTAASLVAGIAWVAVLEPFTPPVQAGQDIGQRMDRRLIDQAQVYVKDSTGFRMDTLYSGDIGPHLPAPGSVVATRRWPAWDIGEDATQPPPLREQSYLDRPAGRAFDPRWAVVKDTPGPIDVLEIAMRTTV